MTESDDFLTTVREKYERAVERENDNRTRALDDIKFARLGEQWPEKIRKEREDDTRPCLVLNLQPSFIRQVVNTARQNRPSITVIPADSGADPETAEIMSGLIRNIEVSSDADIAYDTAIDCAVTGGFGYFRINTDYTSDDTFDQDIVIERIADPFTVYADPDSESADGSDWNCAFIVKTLTKDEFAQKYKGKDAVDWEALGYTGLPAPWLDGDHVLVAEYWSREDVEGQIIALSNGEVLSLEEFEEHSEEFNLAGITRVGEPRTVRRKKVTQYVVSGAEVLETVEWQGKYIPIVPVYGDEITIEGERYFRSLIHDAKDAQREMNYWRSAATESVALAPQAPFMGPVGAFDTDRENWDTSNRKNHATLEYDGSVPPQRQNLQSIPAAEIQMAMAASDDMKAIIGLYNPSLGAQSNVTSGVGLRQQQRQGDIGTFHFIDNLTRSIRQAGRILIDLIPKVYSSARVLRVLGDDLEPQNVQVAPQDQREMVQQQAMQRGQEIARIYDLTAGKYDLVVKAGPSYASQREFAQAEIVEIIRAVPESASILGPMYLENSDWPGAKEAAEQMKAMAQGPQADPEAQKQMQAMSQALQQLQQENQQLKMDQTVKQAELTIKAKDSEIKEFEAQTDRIRALVEANTPAPTPPQGSAYAQ